MYGWALDKFWVFGVTWLLVPKSRNYYGSANTFVTFAYGKTFIDVRMIGEM